MNEKHFRCAWCNSTNTHFVRVCYWEEDEYHPGDESMSPMDEEWWCDDCDAGFIVDIDEEDHERE